MKRKELSIETLTEEAMQLLRMEIGSLYVSLGAQLLGHNHPTRVAGIVSYLSAMRSASQAKGFYNFLPSGEATAEWGTGLAVILDELKKEGMGFFEEVREELQKALCHEDILRLCDSIDRPTMHMVVTVVGAVLRMPRGFDPICATVAAVVLGIGLRNFCRQTGETARTQDPGA
jgi:hypothetical protein